MSKHFIKFIFKECNSNVVYIFKIDQISEVVSLVTNIYI